MVLSVDSFPPSFPPPATNGETFPVVDPSHGHHHGFVFVFDDDTARFFGPTACARAVLGASIGTARRRRPRSV